MSILNPYYWLFYILYKFIKLTTKQELQHIVPESSTNVLLIGLTNYLATFFIFTRIFQYFPKNIYSSIIVFSIIPVSLYFINKHLFIKNEKYKEIENYYDKNNKLKKGHFILIAILYLGLSTGMMIWAGINYTN